MIRTENWKNPQDSKYFFNGDEEKIIKSSISHMRSGINRLEQDFTKQNSLIDGLSFEELVKLHNQLGMFYTNTFNLLELVSEAENIMAKFLNKYM